MQTSRARREIFFRCAAWPCLWILPSTLVHRPQADLSSRVRYSEAFSKDLALLSPGILMGLAPPIILLVMVSFSPYTLGALLAHGDLGRCCQEGNDRSGAPWVVVGPSPLLPWLQGEQGQTSRKRFCKILRARRQTSRGTSKAVSAGSRCLGSWHGNPVNPCDRLLLRGPSAQQSACWGLFLLETHDRALSFLGGV